ncbi:hypothetical protein JB92DRAFT_3268881, partial [Gautieria morchelliformis]
AEEHRQKIYDWLAAPDHESKHRNARNVRQKATGSWFVGGERFQEWRVAPHSFLWLHGIPGAGKAILCSTVIEELSLHCRSDPSLAIAFFYFDFNNKDSLLNVVLRSLIKQLSLRANTFHALESLFAQNEHGGAHRAPDQEELMNTLKSIIKGYQTVYIVFDALDECPERSRFLEVIEEINDWKFDILHLMATSRKERDIEEMLAADRAGRFRWVVCQLDALRKCRTPAALEKALTRLPKTLYETYDRILEAIDGDDRRDALRLLQWLAFSFGTLSTDQAVEVIATDPDAEDGPLFDRRRRLRDPRDILTICLSLVTITFQADSNSIRLAHFSVREYLISEHLQTSTTAISVYYFNERMAHVFIAKTCLAYLLHFDSANRNPAMSYPLSFYATHNWMDHAGVLQRAVSQCHDETVRFLIEKGADVNAQGGHYGSALQTAASRHHDAIVQLLIEKGADVNVQGGHYGNALQTAALQGDDTIVQLLIEKGADVNAHGGEHGSALQAAAIEGHDTAVQ